MIESPAASVEEQVMRGGRLGASCRFLVMSPALLAGVVDEVQNSRGNIGVFGYVNEIEQLKLTIEYTRQSQPTSVLRLTVFTD
jgi:hypothetical protein